MWYAFTPEGQVDIPTTLYERIHNAYEVLNNNLPPGTNPVKKIPIVVTGNEAEVYIDEIPEGIINATGNAEDDQGIANPVVGNGAASIDRPICEQLLALHSQMLSLR